MERIVKNLAVLEITSSAIKFAVGYSIDKTPHILHYKRMPLEGYIKDGRVTDPAGLGKAIAELSLIEDEDLKLKVNTGSVSLILPPIGFHVFQNQKCTSLVHETVEAIDVTNVTGMVRRDEVPAGNRIVDIVPEYYILDNGTPYINPPLGNRGSFLTLSAKIYTLPEDVFNSYVQSVHYAGLELDRTSVAISCATRLMSAEGKAPDRYFYVDMGDKITTISLVANGSPFGSLSTSHGASKLTEKISNQFGIDIKEAENLKIRFGYREIKAKYNAPIFSKTSDDGKKISVTQEALNKVIMDYYGQYANCISTAIETLAKNQLRSQNQPDGDTSRFMKLPIVISGGASMLNGLDKALESLKLNGERQVMFFTPSTLGARHAEATNIIGLIVAEGEYKGDLEENYHRVSTLTRGK